MNDVSEAVENAIKSLCDKCDATHPNDSLIGIGVMVDDTITNLAVYLLRESMIPGDSEAEYRFNPMDWDVEAQPLTAANALLSDRRSAAEFSTYARSVFNACIAAFQRLDFHNRYGSALFITMGGVDPTDLLEQEEFRFVRRVNNTPVIEAWLRDYA